MTRNLLLLFLALFGGGNNVDADMIGEGAASKQRTRLDVVAFEAFNSPSYRTLHKVSSVQRKASNKKRKDSSSIKSKTSHQSTTKVSKKSSKKGGKRGKISEDASLEPTERPDDDDGFDSSSPTTFPSLIGMTLPPEVEPSLSPTSIASPPPVVDPTSPAPEVNPTIDPTVNPRTPMPQPTTVPSPSPSPSANPDEPHCRVPTDKCCQNSDCGSEMICAGRNCVSEGSLRITLTWFGQDNKDLGVETPDGHRIDKLNANDSPSDGILEGDYIPASNGYHAENLYFPIDNEIISGTYLVGLVGNSNSELWKVAVAVAGKEVSSFAGTDAVEYFAIDVYTVPGGCKVPSNECCIESDCNIDETCQNRNCIKKGAPRFTLVWYGSDDKDLIVTTPGLVDIFFDNPFDPVSGGELEEDIVPEGVGFHAENIYFPMGPLGMYAYFIRGGGSDIWNVSIALDDLVVERVSGVGDGAFQFQFADVLPTSSPFPATQSPMVLCTTSDFECCMDSDCSNGESCANKNCVQDGALRFTLTWSGQGDIDLRVQPPEGDLIYFQNPFDPVSGGTLENDVGPSEFGYYAENIYFIDETVSQGMYIYGVSGASQAWELFVYRDGELAQMHSGVGLSSDFGFELGPCDLKSQICCDAPDCIEADVGDVCANRNCIQEGVIRFTLSWNGTDDKDLLVSTPAGTVINFSTPVDEITGGILEFDTRPYEYGNYVENIFFPESHQTPEGMYTYEISSGGIDPWTAEVFVDGELFKTSSGVGGGDAISFEFGGGRARSGLFG